MMQADTASHPGSLAKRPPARARRAPPADHLSVGATALELLAALPALVPELVRVELRAIKPVHQARARIAAGEDKTVALLRHDDDPIQPFSLGRERLLAGGAVERIIRHYLPDEDHVLALSSRVGLVGGDAHLLILDFIIPPSLRALRDIIRGVRLAGWTGAVLETGSSYHFIGVQPMTEAQWNAAMGRALLMTDLIDVRYCAHALVRRAGSARLTTCALKPHQPRVVAVVR